MKKKISEKDMYERNIAIKNIEISELHTKLFREKYNTLMLKLYVEYGLSKDDFINDDGSITNNSNNISSNPDDGN